MDLLNIEFKRKVYHYIFNIVEIPFCKTCKGIVKYRRIIDGYCYYCSDKCVKRSDEYYNKWISSVKKSNADGKHIEKRKETLIDKYGINYKKLIQKNREKSMYDKYGVVNSFQIEEIKINRKKILKEKYGIETYNNPKKTKKTRIDNGTQINDELINDFIDYKKIAINRTNTIYRNNKELINPNTLKRSRKGYHLDHIFSLKKGFLMNIPIEIITHPYNLHMIKYKDNLVKQDDCWITIEELLDRISISKIEIKVGHSILIEKYNNINIIASELLNKFNI